MLIDEGYWPYVAIGGYGRCLYFPINFMMNLKLPQKVSLFKKKKMEGDLKPRYPDSLE